jgi:hypothetical protein
MTRQREYTTGFEYQAGYPQKVLYLNSYKLLPVLCMSADPLSSIPEQLLSLFSQTYMMLSQQRNSYETI